MSHRAIYVQKNVSHGRIRTLELTTLRYAPAIYLGSKYRNCKCFANVKLSGFSFCHCNKSIYLNLKKNANKRQVYRLQKGCFGNTIALTMVISVRSPQLKSQKYVLLYGQGRLKIFWHDAQCH